MAKKEEAKPKKKFASIQSTAQKIEDRKALLDELAGIKPQPRVTRPSKKK